MTVDDIGQQVVPGSEGWVRLAPLESPSTLHPWTSEAEATPTTTLRPNVVINPVTETEADKETEEQPEKDIDFRIVELFL